MLIVRNILVVSLAMIIISCSEDDSDQFFPLDTAVNSVKCKAQNRPKGWNKDYAPTSTFDMDGVKVWAAKYHCQVKDGAAVFYTYFALSKPSRFDKDLKYKYIAAGECIIGAETPSGDFPEKDSLRKGIMDTLKTKALKHPACTNKSEK